MWQSILPLAISGLSGVLGATFGGSKKEQTTNESYQYTEANQYSYSENYSPQYTLTYAPVVTINSPETSVYPNISQDTALAPNVPTTQNPSLALPHYQTGSQGLDLSEISKPLLLGAVILGVAYIMKK